MTNCDIAGWLPQDGRYMRQPGCATVFAPSPGSREGSCTVGVVNEHRFAFCFWAKYASESERKPPCLITLDSHDDVGGRDDLSDEELDALPVSDATVVCLYSWLRLSPLNDGQIYPALRLGFFSDAYVFLSGLSVRNRPPRQYEDHFGKAHRVSYFNKERNLLEALPTCGDIVLDIDLDFFARGNNNSSRDPRSAIPWLPQDIRRFLRRKKGVIQKVLPRVVGMTIALEPRYCGGFVNSLRILEAVNRELFCGTLGTQEAIWRNART